MEQQLMTAFGSSPMLTYFITSIIAADVFTVILAINRHMKGKRKQDNDNQ